MTLSIIGAGFGRTGTESLKIALEMLGIGKCYHMHEVMPYQDRIDTWRAIAKGEAPDWDTIFHGYRATVDWPAAFYWRALAAHFPKAKILLSVRDANRWYDSMDKTILARLRNKTDSENLIFDQVFGGNIEDRDHVIATYEKNTADVQAAFPKKRLLTYRPGDGWKPLCAFLDLPVPDVPYPHKNQTDEFHQKVEALDKAREEGRS